MKTHLDKDPLISIALCTFNGEKYLQAQLDSILSQSYTNFELVIVDDTSTDSTLSIIKNYALRDPRIRFFVNESNLGYNKNFEKAFGLCLADFIAISDQDDVWEKEKIKKMMGNWPDKALMIYSLSGEFHGNNIETYKEKKRILHHNSDDTRKIVFSSDIVGHAIIFKKELLDYCMPFPAEIFYDWWLSMHAADRSFIACIPEVLNWHRIHEKNASHKAGSIQDKKLKQQFLRDQYAHFIETFFSRAEGRPEERKSLLHYASLLRKMDGRKFNIQMFQYVLKTRKQIFHYKKKPFLSHLKHAFRMGYTGLLRS